MSFAAGQFLTGLPERVEATLVEDASTRAMPTPSTRTGVATMYAPRLNGDWEQLSLLVRARWPRLSDADVLAIDGERRGLVRTLKVRYGKSYGELEREVTDFDLRDIRAANMARPSLGITNE